MTPDVLLALPEDLPVPEDDGACDHLEGLSLPDLTLMGTDQQPVNLSRSLGWVVIFCYPMTGRPGRAIPSGWAQIPGAAGCTLQACSFRDHFREIRAMGVVVYGLSTQSADDQAEAVKRLHLPFPLLSDQTLAFSEALRLPTIDVQGARLTKRITMVAKNGVVHKCFYPVFPPDENVNDVITWLAANKT